MTNKKFLKKLQDMYPWFDECKCWLPRGWQYLVLDLCAELEKMVDENFKFYYLDESCGKLRVYTNSEDDKVLYLIEEYVKVSMRICICCGDWTLGTDDSGMFPIALCPECEWHLDLEYYE